MGPDYTATRALCTYSSSLLLGDTEVQVVSSALPASLTMEKTPVLILRHPVVGLVWPTIISGTLSIAFCGPFVQYRQTSACANTCFDPSNPGQPMSSNSSPSVTLAFQIDNATLLVKIFGPFPYRVYTPSFHFLR